MFESITDRRDRRTKRLTQLLIAFLALHFVGITIAIVVDQLRVQPVREPAVAITFVDFAQAAPPPPPPPPPPKKRTTPKKTEVKPQDRPKEFVAPKEIPQAEPAKEQEDDQGSDNGVEGGVIGGVEGGVVGGVVGEAPKPPPPPPPPPKPPPPVQQQQTELLARRIEGRDPPYPAAMERRQIEGTVEAKILVSPEGRVTEIVILKATPGFEAAVREHVMGWRFRPFLVNGQPAPTTGIIRFVYRLQD